MSLFGKIILSRWFINPHVGVACGAITFVLSMRRAVKNIEKRITSYSTNDSTKEAYINGVFNVVGTTTTATVVGSLVPVPLVATSLYGIVNTRKWLGMKAYDYDGSTIGKK